MRVGLQAMSPKTLQNRGYNPAKLADRKSPKNDQENHRNKKNPEVGKDELEISANNLIKHNHEIFFTRPGLASSIHPPTRDEKRVLWSLLRAVGLGLVG